MKGLVHFQESKEKNQKQIRINIELFKEKMKGIHHY